MIPVLQFGDRSGVRVGGVVESAMGIGVVVLWDAMSLDCVPLRTVAWRLGTRKKME